MTQKCDGDGDEDADEDMLVLAATRASTKTTMKTVKNMFTVDSNYDSSADYGLHLAWW